MSWNWQQDNWPNFHWDPSGIVQAEQLYLENAGQFSGATKNLNADEKKSLNVDMLLAEALSTSEIEGELLNRDSVQASIKRALGLQAARLKTEPAESGIAEMMVYLHENLKQPISEKNIFEWHKMILNGRRDIEKIGAYRAHEEPMLIVSGPDYGRKVHFEAPPSKKVKAEMAAFLKWYRDTAPGKIKALPPVTRAGIAHLWFESIHPFEDGNGRIGRAIAEKILAEGLNNPSFTLLGKVMLRHRKKYYQSLSKANKSMEITDWLIWFSSIVLEAQEYTQTLIDFIIGKTKLLDSLIGKLNKRQEKVLLRVLREGPDGFTGGLSAANYMSITGATVATTTRDLRDMVEIGIFVKIGDRKSTRYHLQKLF